jgi:hypothetical protein
MKKLTLTFALLLTATAVAHAQDSRTPAGTQYPPGSSEIYPKKIKDPVQLDEAHIANARVRTTPSEREAASARYNRNRSFKAVVEVTNHAAKAIKSVEWTATLTDSLTGDIISTYDVTTKSNIAPGKTKKLSKNLRTPAARVVSAAAGNPYRPQVGNIQVEVKTITYADGTTSTTP